MLNRFKFPFIIYIFLSICPIVLFSQQKNPVTWSFTAEAKSDSEAIITITATIEDGWHLYTQYMEDGGPQPTEFIFESVTSYRLSNKLKENSEVIQKYDSTFMLEVGWFSKTAVFSQRIKLKSKAFNVPIKGKVKFMACTDQLCLPVREIPFVISITRRTNIKRTPS